MVVGRNVGLFVGDVLGVDEVGDVVGFAVDGTVEGADEVGYLEGVDEGDRVGEPDGGVGTGKLRTRLLGKSVTSICAGLGAYKPDIWKCYASTGPPATLVKLG